MVDESTAATIDEYVARCPHQARKLLKEVRALICASAPEATETISYGIPTFDLNGRHLLHFAGYARHAGLYPVPGTVEAFRDELAPYASGKATAKFPLRRPLPADLIRRIVEYRVTETVRKASHARSGSGRAAR